MEMNLFIWPLVASIIFMIAANLIWFTKPLGDKNWSSLLTIFNILSICSTAALFYVSYLNLLRLVLMIVVLILAIMALITTISVMIADKDKDSKKIRDVKDLYQKTIIVYYCGAGLTLFLSVVAKFS
jgi:hypothetical protein